MERIRSRDKAVVEGDSPQHGRTSEMVFPVDYLIRYISNMMTLMPADIVATGTPEGVGPLKNGDVCEVEIEGIGVLRNEVKAFSGTKLKGKIHKLTTDHWAL